MSDSNGEANQNRGFNFNGFRLNGGAVEDNGDSSNGEVVNGEEERNAITTPKLPDFSKLNFGGIIGESSNSNGEPFGESDEEEEVENEENIENIFSATNGESFTLPSLGGEFEDNESTVGELNDVGNDSTSNSNTNVNRVVEDLSYDSFSGGVSAVVEDFNPLLDDDDDDELSVYSHANTNNTNDSNSNIGGEVVGGVKVGDGGPFNFKVDGREYGLNGFQSRVEMGEVEDYEVSDSGTVFAKALDVNGEPIKIVALPRESKNNFTERDVTRIDLKNQAILKRMEKKRNWDKNEFYRVQFSKSRRYEFGAGKYVFENDHVNRPVVEYIVDGEGRLLTDKRGKLIKDLETPEGFEALVEQAQLHGRVNFPEGDFGRFKGNDLVSGEERKDKIIYPWDIKSGVDKIGGVVETTNGTVDVDGMSKSAKRRKQKLNIYEEGVFRSFSGSGVKDNAIIKSLVRPEADEEFAQGADEVVESKYLNSVKANVGVGLRPKDIEILQFLAKFRYATDRHVGRLWGGHRRQALTRLKHLKDMGLVRTIMVYGTSDLWVCTESGMAVSGYDLPTINEDKMNLSMLPHQFTVNNTAANLIGGGVNVLGLDRWPERNRRGFRGNKVFGETLVSETELRSNFGKFVGLTKSSEYRPKVVGAMNEAFTRWEVAGGMNSGLLSPEFQRGNEYMWILYPPTSLHKIFHVPDLVVARPRSADGSPNSIAVEIETVDTKAMDVYYKTLRSYKADDRIFGKIIWVCKTAAVSRRIEAAARELDMWDNGRVDTVPVLTESGVFEGRELWLI